MATCVRNIYLYPLSTFKLGLMSFYCNTHTSNNTNQQTGIQSGPCLNMEQPCPDEPLDENPAFRALCGWADELWLGTVMHSQLISRSQCVARTQSNSKLVSICVYTLGVVHSSWGLMLSGSKDGYWKWREPLFFNKCFSCYWSNKQLCTSESCSSSLDNEAGGGLGSAVAGPAELFLFSLVLPQLDLSPSVVSFWGLWSHLLTLGPDSAAAV